MQFGGNAPMLPAGRIEATRRSKAVFRPTVTEFGGILHERMGMMVNSCIVPDLTAARREGKGRGRKKRHSLWTLVYEYTTQKQDSSQTSSLPPSIHRPACFVSRFLASTWINVGTEAMLQWTEDARLFFSFLYDFLYSFPVLCSFPARGLPVVCEGKSLLRAARVRRSVWYM